MDQMECPDFLPTELIQNRWNVETLETETYYTYTQKHTTPILRNILHLYLVMPIHHSSLHNCRQKWCYWTICFVSLSLVLVGLVRATGCLMYCVMHHRWWIVAKNRMVLCAVATAIRRFENDYSLYSVGDRNHYRFSLILVSITIWLCYIHISGAPTWNIMQHQSYKDYKVENIASAARKDEQFTTIYRKRIVKMTPPVSWIRAFIWPSTK